MRAVACSPLVRQATWRRDVSHSVLAARAPLPAQPSSGGYAAAQAARAARGRRALQVQAFSLLKNRKHTHEAGCLCAARSHDRWVRAATL